MIFFLLTSYLYASLPSDWYTLPEYDRGEKFRVENTLTPLLKGQRKVLKDIGYLPRRKWSLEAIRLGLGISVKGLVGLVSLSGKSSTLLTWTRKGSSIPDRGDKSIKINVSSSSEEVTKQLVEESSFALNELNAQAKKNALNKLKNKTAQMQKIYLELLNGYDGGEWFIDTLRYDLSFDAEGNILPFMSLKGEVKLRLEFFSIKTNHSYSNKTNFLGPTAKFARLLLKDARYALSSQTLKSIEKMGYEFKVLRIGIGMGISGDITVASLGAESMAQIYLKKTQTNKNQITDIADEPLPYLAQSNELRENFARKNNIKFDDLNEKGLSSKKVYYITRKKFRKGLMKALRVGKFFTNLAKEQSTKRWHLGLIENEFELSIGGTLSLVKINGVGIVRFVFKKSVL